MGVYHIIKKRFKFIVIGLLSALFLFLATSNVSAATTVTVSGDTASGENQPGRLFNRDANTSTTAFNTTPLNTFGTFGTTAPPPGGGNILNATNDNNEENSGGEDSGEVQADTAGVSSATTAEEASKSSWSWWWILPIIAALLILFAILRRRGDEEEA